MNLNFVDIMLVVLFFQLLSVAPYLLLEKGKINKKFLGLFLSAKAFCISNFLSFRLSDYTLSYFPHLFYFGSSFTILWGPLLYFYFRSISETNFKFRKKDLIHFFPFAVHFIYLLITFHLHGGNYKREVILSGGIFSESAGLIIALIVEIFIGVYTLYTIYLNYKYSKKLKENYSDSLKININWLWFILIGFFLKWFSDLNYFIFYWIGIGGTEIILSFSKIVMFVFINYLIFKGFKDPQIFDGLEQTEKKGGLSEKLFDEYKSQLTNIMEKDKPFFNPELSLKELSEKSEIPQRALSEVINNGFGQNFYDFINRYRIKESEKLLSKPSENPPTVLEVLYEVGFKSKSSFHKAFNKHTGMTPSQYRISQKN